MLSYRYILIMLLFPLFLILTSTDGEGKGRLSRKFQAFNRYTLRGSVEFNYKIQTTETATTKKEFRTFGQIYNLNLLGFAWDPKFLIFTTGISFSETSFEGRESKLWKYRFETTIFPMFRYPVTLFVRRNTSESNGFESTTDSYGFRSTLKFRRFPITSLFFTKTEPSDSEGSISYGLNMNKTITKRSSRAIINFRTTTRKFGQNESKFYSLSMTNLIKLSSATALSFGSAYSVSESSSQDGDDNKTRNRFVFLSSGLTIRPSDRLSHTYSYSFSQNDRDNNDSDIRHSFSADIAYKLTEKVSLEESFYLKHSTDESEGEEKIIKKWKVNSTVVYRVKRWLTTTGSVFYSQFERSPATSATDVTFRKDVGVSWSIGSNISILGVGVGTGYGIGYSWFETEPFGTGEKVNQKFNLGLARGIRIKNYVTITPGYAFSTTAGDTPGDNSKEHIFKLDATSNYFKGTNIGVRTGHRRLSTDAQEETHTSTFYGANISHTRRFWRGVLSLGASYNKNMKAIDSDTDSTSRNTAHINYRFMPFRFARAKLFFKRTSKSSDRGLDTTVTNMGGNLQYRLRSWILSVEYDRELSELYDGSEAVRSTVMFRARRDFVRFLN